MSVGVRRTVAVRMAVRGLWPMVAALRFGDGGGARVVIMAKMGKGQLERESVGRMRVGNNLKRFEVDLSCQIRHDKRVQACVGT